METWRLLDTGALSAAENMALYETPLELKVRALGPTMLEFTWQLHNFRREMSF